MRLKLIFSQFNGQDDSIFVEWNGEDVKEFPLLSSYKGKYWSFSFYNSVCNADFNFELFLAETKEEALPYDLYGNLLPITDLEAMFNLNDTVNECECGARFTSFPNFHMPFCKLWEK